MKANSPEKNKGNIIIGLVLCIVCVAFLTITIMAVCESFSEKARLESIGATVTLKITWLFVVDVLVILASGILGIVFLSKSSPAHNSFVEDDIIEDEEDEDIVLYDEKNSSVDVDEVGYDIDAIERFQAEDVVINMGDTSPIATAKETSNPSKLKIKMGNSSSSERASAYEEVKSEKKDSHHSKSSELSNGFFSAGDDL